LFLPVPIILRFIYYVVEIGEYERRGSGKLNFGSREYQEKLEEFF
jgi:hypothetical protein